MSYIDLHLHSYYSDGIYSPKELVKRAKKEGFSIISLTDHHSINGIEEAKEEGRKRGIKVISGIEFNTKFKDYYLHLLGYGVDLKNKKLNLVIEKIQRKYRENAKRCISELKKQGFEIDEETFFSSSFKNINIARLTDFLKMGKNWQKIKKDFNLKNNQIITFPEIYKKYFIKDGKEIFPSVQISFEEAISLIKKANGIPVLAHPAQQLSWKDDFLFPILKKKGLKGIEAISSHHNWANIEHYQKIAKELNLLITVGSDYHGDLPNEWGVPVKSLWQYFKVKLTKEIKINLNKILNL